MNKELNYDLFEMGDKVWSEAYGFGEVDDDYEGNTVAMHFNSIRFDINRNGTACKFEHRARIFFHAVADTDEGMRAAIARGHGLRRTVPRGRFDIKPGDTVFSIIEGRPFVCTSTFDDTTFPLAVGLDFFKENGQGYTTKNFPMWIRLYDGEEPPKTVAERLRFFADEMEKDGWEEKYGGGK